MKIHYKNEYDDDTNSFLGSPKNDVLSFFNGSTQIHDSKVGPISDSTMITR